MDRDRSGRWWYRIDALRLVIKQYQDCRFWLHQARWLSSPSNSIVPKGLRWLPRFIRGSESALRRRTGMQIAKAARRHVGCWHQTDMPIGFELVCFLGQTGSEWRRVRTTRLTLTGVCTENPI